MDLRVVHNIRQTVGINSTSSMDSFDFNIQEATIEAQL